MDVSTAAAPERPRASHGADPTKRLRWWQRALPWGKQRIKVLVHRGDPYLALLLRLQLPGCELLAADDDATAVALLDEMPALVVAPVRPGSTFLETLLARQD